MSNWSQHLYLICCLFSLSMLWLSWALYQRRKDLELGHLREFWASMVVSAGVQMAFANQTGPLAALSMLGWIWPLRTAMLVTADISGVNGTQRWHSLIFATGALLTFILSGQGLPFVIFTAPFSLAVGGLGSSLVLASLRRGKSEERSLLRWACTFFLCLFFIRRLFYPLWGLNPELSELGPGIEILSLIGFAVTGLGRYQELLLFRRSSDLEEALRDRSARFQGQSKFSELGMMSAGVVHEISNPLAVIQARATQLLRLKSHADKLQETSDGLHQILRASERIARVLQGLREFVHPDEQEALRDLPLKDLFEDVLGFCGQRMKNHGVSLRFYGLEGASVPGHKIQLEQLILNLLNNSFDAIEFLPDKWVEVSCHKEDGQLHVFFKDSGHGIPPGIAPKIMEPFFSTKNAGKGTGLGLSMAQEIAQNHGGALAYLPTCSHTTFRLDLPLTVRSDWNFPLQ